MNALFNPQTGKTLLGLIMGVLSDPAINVHLLVLPEEQTSVDALLRMYRSCSRFHAHWSACLNEGQTGARPVSEACG